MSEATEFNSPLLELAKRNAPHWQNDEIIAFDENAYSDAQTFAKTHYWTDDGSINVFRVIGTRHPDYQGWDWEHLLKNGKRMPKNHSLWENNPGYYTNDDPKLPQMSFISLNGQDWYVDADGNHRTCIALYYFDDMQINTLKGVRLSDWRENTPFKEAFRRAERLLNHRKIPAYLAVKKEVVSRQDNPGWRLDEFRLTAMVDSGSLPKRFLGELDIDGLNDLIKYLGQPLIKRILGQIFG